VAEVDDGYCAYYAERLWQLLPAVYRTADTDSFDAPGPLRELVNRIGAQMAVVRRSIDRLWADQSIETCDDWVIPYIGDLLGTNLVSNLDPAAQRLDVARTIHYRRRKGTVAVLEELAGDVTGWTAHVVEGFRRLARTRHGLDPAVGPGAFPSASADDLATFLQTEGLTGLLTGGPAGGFADLRSSHGASLVNTAFDESFHTADFRVGRGALGHFGIPKLIVFLWRLTSFQVTGATPVAVAGCDNYQYVFDPTGREIPLFLPQPAVPDYSSGAWTPAREWQVPGPLTSSLEKAITDTGADATPPARAPYPNVGVPPGDVGVPPGYTLNGAQVAGTWPDRSIWPEIGRFAADQAPPEDFTVDYCYGFSATIGAGPYEPSVLGDLPSAQEPETTVTGGGNALAGALGGIGATGTITIGDSRTYTALAPAAEPVASLVVRVGQDINGQNFRPVLRPVPDAGPLVFTAGPGGELVLYGLTVSGCDIVLRGSFDTVSITACTVDPGTAADGSPPLATAADGVTLAPCRIFIEADPDAPGAIGQLLIDHCILGPIRTRYGGSVETVTITDSILQGLPATAGPSYTAADVFDPLLLASGLTANDRLAQALLAAMPQAAVTALQAYAAQTLASQESGQEADLEAEVVTGLNALVGGQSLYDPGLFATVNLSADVLALGAGAATLDPADLAALNRGLLDESFPVALGVAALAIADATVQLTRVTVLGRIAAHRLLLASDSILRDFAAVDDTQYGCVRFCAYASGSAIPRQYESAAIPPGAPIFTSDSYGQPGYAQLLETADTAITGGTPGASISAGAENGAEMGAFCADLNPVKEQGLLIKYAEYMPLGLTPVIVHVT
jgi:hypothetical protein